MDTLLTIVLGDITRLQVDAIVNAANRTLLGGGGVDGAIHRAAGPELLEECRSLDGCAAGAAKITRGYRLPAKWIIHTVGPIWRGGSQNEDQVLASCYRTSLALAQQYRLSSIAFPAISTGAYGFPLERAAHIALKEISGWIQAESGLTKIIFCCFDPGTRNCYRTSARELGLAVHLE